MNLFDDPRWDAYGMLREAYLATSRRIDAEVSPAGDFDASISDLLFRLARTPGRALRAVDIARALATSTTRTTRLLDLAEESGLVIREPHPSDGRAILVTLTRHGLAQARKRGIVALSSAQSHIYDVLTADEIATMVATLRKLRDANQ